MYMNPEAQEYLDNILKKNPEGLSNEEIKFLKARKSYLKNTQLEEYASVLNPKPNPVVGTVKQKDANSK